MFIIILSFLWKMAPVDDKIENDMQNVDITNQIVSVSFAEPRHTETIEGEILDKDRESWRMKDRMKTVSVALVLCLHVGVDPPDVAKVKVFRFLSLKIRVR